MSLSQHQMVKIMQSNFLRIMLNILGIIVFSFILSSCSTSKATIHTTAVSYLNPDINGQASPVVITVYQLKNSYSFIQADYEALSENSGQVLGDDLIDKNSFEIQPAHSETIKEILHSNTKYIGIVAAYRNQSVASWHKAIALKHAGSSIKIKVDLESEGITVKKA